MWGRFHIPVLALFYIASQVSVPQFTIIMSVFALSTLLLEVPSGVLADFLGKKKTLLISRFLYIVEVAILAFTNGFWLFLIAKICSGVAVSLSSGTDNSLLYDTVKKLGRTKEYKKIKGTSFAITNSAMALVFISGAFFFSLDTKLPAKLSLIPISLGFLLTFFLKEPYAPFHHFSWNNTVKHLKESIHTIWRKRELRYVVGFIAVIGAAVDMQYTLFALTLQALLIPVTLFGVAMFLTSIITAWSGKQAHKISSWSYHQSLFTPILLAGAAFLFLSLLVPIIGYVAFLFIALAAGFFKVWSEDTVNSMIPSSHRATMLSIKNFFVNIIIFLSLPLLGLITETYSPAASLWTLAVAFIISNSVLTFFYRRNFSKHSQKSRVA